MANQLMTDKNRTESILTHLITQCVMCQCLMY